jgi:hypothetical protein
MKDKSDNHNNPRRFDAHWFEKGSLPLPSLFFRDQVNKSSCPSYIVCIYSIYEMEGPLFSQAGSGERGRRPGEGSLSIIDRKVLQPLGKPPPIDQGLSKLGGLV